MPFIYKSGRSAVEVYVRKLIQITVRLKKKAPKVRVAGFFLRGLPFYNYEKSSPPAKAHLFNRWCVANVQPTYLIKQIFFLFFFSCVSKISQYICKAVWDTSSHFEGWLLS